MPPRRGTALTRTGKWKGVFLGVLAETGNVSAAIRAAGVARQTAYTHQCTDAKFAQDWTDALDQGTDALKAEAWRRAKDGVDVPITHEGEQCFIAIEEASGLCVPNEIAFEMVESSEWAKPAKKLQLRKGFKLKPFVKKQYSDAILMMLLKAGRPSEFGDNLRYALPVNTSPEPIVLVHTAPPPENVD